MNNALTKYIISLSISNIELYVEALKRFVKNIDNIFIEKADSLPRINLFQFDTDKHTIEQIDTNLAQLNDFPFLNNSGVNFTSQGSKPEFWNIGIVIEKNLQIENFYQQVVNILNKHKLTKPSFFTNFIYDGEPDYFIIAKISELDLEYTKEFRQYLNQQKIMLTLTIDELNEDNYYVRTLKTFPA